MRNIQHKSRTAGSCREFSLMQRQNYVNIRLIKNTKCKHKIKPYKRGNKSKSKDNILAVIYWWYFQAYKSSPSVLSLITIIQMWYRTLEMQSVTAWKHLKSMTVNKLLCRLRINSHILVAIPLLNNIGFITCHCWDALGKWLTYTTNSI